MKFNLNIWLKALRVPFTTATLIPVALGSILGWYDARVFSWPRFWLAMAGALLLHFGTNLANDYFDHLSGNDAKNLNPTPFSGGSRVIQQGLIPPQQIFYVSLVSFILGSAIGFYLNHVLGGWVILVLGATGVCLGFFYSAGPLRIGYGGLGELAVGLGFGPLMVLGAYYVQAQALSARVFLISLPIGLLIALVLLINEFPDYLADKAVGKKTLVVALGKERAVLVYHLLLGSVYILIAVLAIFKYLPLISLIVFLSLPLAIKAFLVSRRHFNSVAELLPANASTIGLHFIIGVLLCAGFILERAFR